MPEALTGSDRAPGSSRIRTRPTRSGSRVAKLMAVTERRFTVTAPPPAWRLTLPLAERWVAPEPALRVRPPADG